jgi:hypothetical protein
MLLFFYLTIIIGVIIVIGQHVINLYLECIELCPLWSRTQICLFGFDVG